MASIRKQEGARGVTYKITVTSGTDCNGKQIRHYMTWKPDKNMTVRQMEKGAQRAAFEFERRLELGYQPDNRQTFAEYAEYFVDLQARRGIADSTIALYRYAIERTVPAIGHLKLQDIRPQHINALCASLEAARIQRHGDRAIPRGDFKALLSSLNLTQTAIYKGSGISHGAIKRLCGPDGWVNQKHAEKIAELFQKNKSEIFKLEHSPRHLSKETVRRCYAFVRSVLALAEKEMLIPYNPAEKATPPKQEQFQKGKYFQPDELQRILEAADKEPIERRTLVYFLACTGCRIGETLGLKWDKVDLEHGEIKIDNSLHYLPEKGVYDGPTKTKNTRFVIVPAEVVTLLRKARAAQCELQLLNGDRWKGGNYVFTKLDGGPIVPGSINVWFNRFSARHGLPHIHPHQFRHTAASIMIGNGVDIVTVSKMLGHSNTSTTMNVYSHIIEESKRKAAECIADVILRKRA